MSVFNGARFLRPAVDSILSQTLDDFEFIVVDDGSTDETARILEEYEDPRIILQRNEKNLGLAQSLNRGVSLAQADLIARQDSDDISHPERLNALVSFLDRNPETGVVGSAVQWIDEESRSDKVWPQGLDNQEIQQLLLRTCPLIHGSTAYRKLCFDDVSGYDTRMVTGQDYDFWLRISEIWDLECLPEVLYRYRQHEGMASVQYETEQSEFARSSLQHAVARRYGYFPKIWSRNSRMANMMRRKGRRWLARRYVWWAAGARPLGKVVAARFLLRAVILDPSTPEIWRFLRGVAGRKRSWTGLRNRDSGEKNNRREQV
jgi:glycosyltransferase involved in cell wall biosynthesis